MANGWGGKRPGAGRKPKDIENWRRQNERILASRLNADEMADVVDRWLARLRAGDPSALWLIDRLFGKVGQVDKQKQEVSGEVTIRVVRDRAGGTAPLPSPPVPGEDPG